MKKVLINSFILLFVMGCASPTKKEWRKEGVSRHDVGTSLSACRYEIGIAKIAQEEKTKMFIDCMQGKGFRYY